MSEETSKIAALEQQFASQDAPVAESADVTDVDQTDEHEGEDESAASTEAGSQDKVPRGKKSAAERLQEVLAERKEARKAAKRLEEEKEHWRQEALKAAQPKTASPPPSPRAPQGKTLADFGGDQEAYLDYRLDEREKAREQARFEAAAREKAQAVQSAHQKRVADFEAAHPDIDFEADIANNQSIPISTASAAFIRESDVGPELALYLRDNPDEAKEIRGLSEVSQLRRLSKIEDKLEAAKTPKRQPPAPSQITRAPPVPGRVSAGRPGRGSPDEGFEAELAAVRERKSRR